MIWKPAESRSSAGSHRAWFGQVRKVQVFRGIDLAVQELLLEHGIDRLLDGRGADAGAAVAIVVTLGRKVGVEAIDIVREEGAYRVRVLAEKLVGGHLKDDRGRAEHVAPREQGPQIALAA